MDFLTELWLPIVLAGVFVWIASSILHMVIPHHRSDFTKTPGETEVLSGMRAQNVSPGNYMFPWASSMKDLATPEMLEKYKQGPVGFMNIVPSGQYNMGKSLAQWFGFVLAMSALVAYVARLTIDPGADYLTVFRVTGAIATIGYAFSNISDSIWKGQKWSTSFKFVCDGIVYGLVTGGTFGWLWPEATG